jgi:hypothetical protein
LAKRCQNLISGSSDFKFLFPGNSSYDFGRKERIVFIQKLLGDRK